MKELLNQINTLAKKEREVGLSAQEKEEQQQLRKEYIKNFRGQVLSTLTGLTIVDPLGNDVTPEKVKKLSLDNEK
ncbi:DUF896 domain-containing protein [Alkalicoccobacillus gibsonii]|jgi:uncharacterized protein YnzC (UPF0291/DUF896 family)|uniref:DUF896 domain-containing protein n=1 Tax=Alkalicoccobacillus gibsonii TaxID=79881 RepID=UPI003F7C6BE9